MHVSFIAAGTKLKAERRAPATMNDSLMLTLAAEKLLRRIIKRAVGLFT